MQCEIWNLCDTTWLLIVLVTNLLTALVCWLIWAVEYKVAPTVQQVVYSDGTVVPVRTENVRMKTQAIYTVATHDPNDPKDEEEERTYMFGDCREMLVSNNTD
eukprot:gnl/MRDRNA2_/MRDRNA2_112256_c0_seq1.p1 gnl/MRDRNA2_/MRDRNA2_112256_c0~~gnl/MRDRNA2_/MRDRNA2_112256_c0_seq1.p1  ORF type:complete len:103 (+),score=18.37 gnl/MRDRNA2_/MRDRNA2_112256_c0_seq1:100-408(+)